jgi:Fe-S-cluster formation regulator IscX/YfhJ
MVMNTILDEYRRAVAEQQRMREFIERSVPSYQLTNAIDEISRCNKLIEQAKQGSIADQVTKAAISSVSEYFNVEALQKISNGQSVLLELEQAQKKGLKEQQELMKSAYAVTQLPEFMSPEILNSIKSPIDEILEFQKHYDYERIAGLTFQEISQFVDPIYERFNDITRDIAELSEIAFDDGNKKQTSLSLEQITAWLITLEAGLKCVVQAARIWLLTHLMQGSDTTLYIEFGSKVTVLFEQHQTIAEKVGNTANGGIHLTTTTTSVKLRTGPSTDNDEKEVLPKNTRFLATSKKGEWASGLAYLEDGRTQSGWVNTDYLVPLSPQGDN